VAAGAAPSPKSNPQDSQNRPDLAAPHCGQASPGTGGCAAGACGASGVPADAPILTPQTSQKSPLTDV
jgi:hypothetical protein